MQTRELYEKYPNDNEYIRSYIAYQERYAKDARDSDKKLIELIGRVLAGACARRTAGRAFGHRMLDRKPAHSHSPGVSQARLDGRRPVGTEHRRTARPTRRLPVSRSRSWIFCGWASGAVATTSSRPTPFSMASPTSCSTASLKAINAALVPGGWLVAFDFFHPWEQNVALIEKSALFPDGHPLHFRSYATRTKALSAPASRSPGSSRSRSALICRTMAPPRFRPGP